MDALVRRAARLIVAILVGVMAVSASPPPRAQAVAAYPPSRGSSIATPQAPQWVLQADRYVRIVNGFAQVDPAIHTHLSQTAVRQVMQAVAHFNALDQHYRTGDVRVKVPAQSRQIVPMANCRGKEEIRVTTYWWGQRFWLSSCTVISVTAAGNNIAAIAGLIAAICPECLPVAAVVAAVLVVYSNWIAWADQYCGGAGVYVDRPWVGATSVSLAC